MASEERREAFDKSGHAATFQRRSARFAAMAWITGATIACTIGIAAVVLWNSRDIAEGDIGGTVSHALNAASSAMTSDQNQETANAARISEQTSKIANLIGDVIKGEDFSLPPQNVLTTDVCVPNGVGYPVNLSADFDGSRTTSKDLGEVVRVSVPALIVNCPNFSSYLPRIPPPTRVQASIGFYGHIWNVVGTIEQFRKFAGDLERADLGISPQIWRDIQRTSQRVGGDLLQEQNRVRVLQDLETATKAGVPIGSTASRTLTLYTLLQILFIRVGAFALGSLIVYFLSTLLRYFMRMAAFHGARADAFRLVRGEPEESFLELAEGLTPPIDLRPEKITMAGQLAAILRAVAQKPASEG